LFIFLSIPLITACDVSIMVATSLPSRPWTKKTLTASILLVLAIFSFTIFSFHSNTNRENNESQGGTKYGYAYDKDEAHSNVDLYQPHVPPHYNEGHTYEAQHVEQSHVYEHDVSPHDSEQSHAYEHETSSDITLATPSVPSHSASSALATAPAKRKAIITSVQRKDESGANWLVDLLPEWDPIVYVTDRTSDEPSTSEIKASMPLLHLPMNVGREASVYLTYIIQNYNNLPDYMVFIHGKRYQIHSDEPMLDTFPTINLLKLDYVDEEGYTALRCNWMHCPGVQVYPELGFEDGIFDNKGLYADAWVKFFPNETIPEKVTGPCCAQFAVTRSVVHRWPIDKYEQIRQWMWARPSGQESMDSGIVLEYLWVRN
jgi:hypothetical protein